MDAPAWFKKALSTPVEDRSVSGEGCAVHYLRWGEDGRPGIVFVHGGAAHAHWWSFIAPLFLPDYAVAAIDLSGHGDSGRRDAYPREIWAREVLRDLSTKENKGGTTHGRILPTAEGY